MHILDPTLFSECLEDNSGYNSSVQAANLAVLATVEEEQKRDVHGRGVFVVCALTPLVTWPAFFLFTAS